VSRVHGLFAFVLLRSAFVVLRSEFLWLRMDIKLEPVSHSSGVLLRYGTHGAPPERELAKGSLL
jgi:hypothetical protein